MASKVLMVAEKPSIALSIATVLSGGHMSTRKSNTDVHEFDGKFLGLHSHFKVTSVIGHVFSVDFPATYQDWTTTDPLDLFQAPILKSESNPKAHIRRHLSQEARGFNHLVLWLDCDREGENICFEGPRKLWGLALRWFLDHLVGYAIALGSLCWLYLWAYGFD